MLGVYYLWNSSLKQEVFHIKSRCVHCGDDDHSNTRMIRRRVFGKMERDMDAAVIVQSDWLKVTYKQTQTFRHLYPVGNKHITYEWLGINPKW